MTTKETDQELEAYFEGSDGISETYSELSDEAPSPALDNLILKAAQDSVANTNSSNGYLSGKYSIAASFIACILIGSLYLGNNNFQSQTDFNEASISNDIQVFEELNNFKSLGMNEEVSSGNAPTSESIDMDTVATSMDFTAASEPVPASVSRELPEIEEIVISPQRAQVSALRYSQETDDDVAISSLESAISETEQSNTFQAEAVMVTGSRIFSDSDTYYRDDPITWLEELYYLTLEAEDANAILQQERDNFLKRYPGIDIDAALHEFLEE